MDMGLRVWKFKLRAHGLKYITIDKSVSSTTTLEALVFIIVVCVIFYSPLLDYKQFKGGICVSVIFGPKGTGPVPYTIDVH